MPPRPQRRHRDRSGWSEPWSSSFRWARTRARSTVRSALKSGANPNDHPSTAPGAGCDRCAPVGANPHASPSGCQYAQKPPSQHVGNPSLGNPSTVHTPVPSNPGTHDVVNAACNAAIPVACGPNAQRATGSPPNATKSTTTVTPSVAVHGPSANVCSNAGPIDGTSALKSGREPERPSLHGTRRRLRQMRTRRREPPRITVRMPVRPEATLPTRREPVAREPVNRAHPRALEPRNPRRRERGLQRGHPRRLRTQRTARHRLTAERTEVDHHRHPFGRRARTLSKSGGRRIGERRERNERSDEKCGERRAEDPSAGAEDRHELPSRVRVWQRAHPGRTDVVPWRECRCTRAPVPQTATVCVEPLRSRTGIPARRRGARCTGGLRLRVSAGIRPASPARERFVVARRP